MARRMLAAGNWKMNGLAAASAVIDEMAAGMGSPDCDVLICPPATLVAALAAQADASPLAIGGQDCHANPSGAHTGDISAEMLADAGASAVIVGHSERRTDHGETDAVIRAKAEAAWRAGLLAVICVGETEAERDSGDAVSVVSGQLAGSVPEGATAANTVIAYEPVWAIGTGRTPSTGDVQEMHAAIRAALTARFGSEIADGVRLLYGGSVKPGNAAEFFGLEDVDGALVGGASLKAADFLPIVAAASAS
ncbi:MAG: triose-phosphate isomerase [Pseudomonadota bacterium]